MSATIDMTVARSGPPERFDVRQLATLFAAIGAVAVPALLGSGLPPSVTFLNQAAAFIGWGIFVSLLVAWLPSGAVIPRHGGLPGLWAALALLGLVALAAAVTPISLPWPLALSSFGTIATAALVATVGAAAQRNGLGQQAFQAFCLGLLVAGLLSSVVALIQYFAPALPDGTVIARSASAGRVGANLRQPNHLSSLLLWSIVALAWLQQWRAEGPRGQPRIEQAAAVLMWILLVLGVVLTVSRTGTVCIVLLALWGVLDRRLSRFSRVMLWLTPLFYIVCWVGVAEWAQASVHAFAGDDQLHKSDLSSSRFAIWSNTLALLAQHPWSGVGWGEFNFAWTLTPFPGRPVAFFDHTHNLPLHLLVELGVPLGGTVMALLCWALWRAGVACWRAGEGGVVRAAFVMVLMMGVHSMLEYPLWYAYFLLPTAFAFGICLGTGAAAQSVPPAGRPAPGTRARSWLLAGSVLLVTGGVVSVLDYLRVSAVFLSSEGAPPLAVRIERGQRSWFFAHHADYAAATTAERPSAAMKAFERAPHYLLDTRLMLAWARAYEERGDIERARYLADRLREFHNPLSDEFFAECGKPRVAGEALPFQCTPSTKAFSYEDFRR